MFVRTTRHVKGFTVTQPLGIMYLAAQLRRHGYRNIELIDMRPDQMAVHRVLDAISRFRPKFLGLSCLSYEAPTARRIAALARRIDPEMHIAMGGPLPSSMKLAAFDAVPVDVIAIGEGEALITRLIDGLATSTRPPSQTALSGIPGLVFRQNSKDEREFEQGYITDLDTLPMPAWDLVDIERYQGAANFNFFLKHPRYMSIMTSRGCPYRCAYCHNVLGKVFRPRSVDHVMDEVRTLHRDFGIREFHLIDDSFNLRLDRAKEILDEMAGLRPEVAIAFPNGIRADRIDEEFLVKAKAAGAYKINFAVETASERLQKKIRKNLKLHKVKEMIRIADGLDIISHGFFMLGFPTETEEEMWQTVDFGLDSRLHTANFFVVQPFEGTDIYEMFKALHPEMVSEAGELDYYKANFEIYEIPAKRIQTIVKQAHLRFFLRPWRAARLARLMPHKSVLLRGGLRLVHRGLLGRG